MTTPNPRPDLRGERGSSLVFTLLVLFGLAALTAGGLAGTRSDQKVTHNYRTGVQALLAAQAGAIHAQQVVDTFGVTSSFTTDIVPIWSTLFGTGAQAMTGGGYAGVDYTVVPGATTATRMVLTSTGRAPNQSLRRVDVTLVPGTAFSNAAIYLPADEADPRFNGNSFLVDGHDHLITGGLNTAGEDVPGIGSRLESVRDEVLDALSNGQYDNVIGAGDDPSVAALNSFDVDRLNNNIVPAILAQPNVVTNPSIHGNDVFGTTTVPQITYFTGDVRLNGNVSGAGILVVNQSLEILGNLDFTGLIIVRGQTTIGRDRTDTEFTGSAVITGAIWTADLDLTIGGNALIRYSSEALEMANVGTSPPLPRHVRAIAWREY